jgi:hypothetical protein
MVHSSAFTIITNAKRLKFIAYCFGGLSLSPKESDSGVIFRSTTHSRPLSLRAMIEDSTKEFYMA